MENGNYILDEYVPLPFLEVSILSDLVVYEYDNGYDHGISYDYFQWLLKTDRKTEQSVFENNQTLEFVSYGGFLPEEIEINGKMIPTPEIKWLEEQNQKFRLPDISYCFHKNNIIVSDKVFKELHLSRKLGTNSGIAILHDPFGEKHSGFYYISFLNPLLLLQAEKRFSKLPSTKRPFIFIKLNQYEETILIHKKLLDRLVSNKCSGLLPLKKMDEEKIRLTSDAFLNEYQIDYDGISNWQKDIIHSIC